MGSEVDKVLYPQCETIVSMNKKLEEKKELLKVIS